MKSILFVDGENFKRKARQVFDEFKKLRPKWDDYDFAGLFNKILQGVKIDKKIFYFARLKEHPQTKEKSKQLIEEQRLLKTHLERQGFEVILSGRVRGQMEDNNKGKSLLLILMILACWVEA